jgi:hypothetical protein
MIILTGAPQAALSKLVKEDGVHFLPLDEEGLPAPNNIAAIFNNYLPSKLTHAEYPALIPEGTSVPTIGNRALLVTYAWPESSPRYHRLSKFVREFFGKIDQFQEGSRHPKWREINVATEIPGWMRFKPAADWIAEDRKVAVSQSKVDTEPDGLKGILEQYLSEYAASTGQKALSDRERQILLYKFQQFLATQMSNR